VSELTISLV
jgi:hypothetical protein